MALANGPGSVAANILPDAAVTLAAANAPLTSRALLDRFARVFAELSHGGLGDPGKPMTLAPPIRRHTRSNSAPIHPLAQSESPALAASAVADLEAHPRFADIEVLGRFLLFLSFNNRLDVAATLPDVLHLCTLLLASGTPLLRSSMLAVLLNVVQSVGTAVPLAGEQLALLRRHLASMLQPKVCVVVVNLIFSFVHWCFGLRVVSPSRWDYQRAVGVRAHAATRFGGRGGSIVVPAVHCLGWCR
jgi:hypothetical protein